MPPSGYSQFQVESIASFLDSCAEALESEAQCLHKTPVHALKDEISNIQATLDAGASEGFGEDVLRLTSRFYTILVAEEPGDFRKFKECVQKVLEQMKANVLAIHV